MLGEKVGAECGQLRRRVNRAKQTQFGPTGMRANCMATERLGTIGGKMGPDKTKPILRLRIADFGLRIQGSLPAGRPYGPPGQDRLCRQTQLAGTNRAKQSQFPAGRSKARGTRAVGAPPPFDPVASALPASFVRNKPNSAQGSGFRNQQPDGGPRPLGFCAKQTQFLEGPNQG